MAIEQLTGGSASSATESVSWVVDYDTVAQTIGLTVTGNGHLLLRVVQSSNDVELDAVNADQFGQTSGTIKQTETFIQLVGQEDAGQSTTNDVTYDGTRHIVEGPGASGVDAHGAALSTKKVSSAVVGAINPPKGTNPTLWIELGGRFNLSRLS